MSTKRLSRTVIEGGRDSWSKWQRRHSHRDVRTKQRAFLSQVRNDPECADDGGVARRQPAWKSFDDKLGPAERYLLKQVGRPWRKVEGEILARFDTRTIAGRHIVYDHLLPGDNESLHEGWRVHRRRFRVDAKGFLRLATARR